MTTPDRTDKVKKQPSLMMTAGVVVVLSVLAGGGGWMLGMMAGGGLSHDGGGSDKSSGSYSDVVAKETQDDSKIKESDDGTTMSDGQEEIVTLSPITTNLSYPSDSWVRLEVALVFADGADIKMAETIHQDMMTYLRTVSLQQLEGPRGFQHLRDDLTERASIRSAGSVSGLLIRTFLVE